MELCRSSEANNPCFSINCQPFRNKIFRYIFRHHLAYHIARSSTSSRAKNSELYLSRKENFLNQTRSRQELALKDAKIRPGQIS